LGVAAELHRGRENEEAQSKAMRRRQAKGTFSFLGIKDE
jgi:hypothetical protein